MIKYTEEQELEYQNFLKEIENLTDEELQDKCEHYIWMSGYAANNQRSNYHRMVDALYSKCSREGKVNIYKAAYKEVVGEL